MNGALALLLPPLALGLALGGNDATNIYGPAVTTRSLSRRWAAAVAALFALLGAVLEGQHGQATYGTLAAQTAVSAVVLAGSAALISWVCLARGLPTSITQTVVGALVGVSLARSGMSGLAWGSLGGIVIAWTVAPLGSAILAYLIYRLARRGLEPRLQGLWHFDRVMAVGFLILAAYGAFALGANNVANVSAVYQRSGLLSPTMSLLLGGGAIALGLLIGNQRVMRTVGLRLTELTPFGGLIVLLVESVALHLYALIGIPISASQAVVGGIVGVGAVKGIVALNRPLLFRLALSWFGAPVAAGLLAASVIGLLRLAGGP